jgi:hypothetical protein
MTALASALSGPVLEDYWLGFTVTVSFVAGLITALYKRIGFKPHWLR